MATDTKYCYISTTTSQSSSQSNYQNIPYRMPTTTPVIYQGSDADPLYYMPIAIWSNDLVFTNTVYYNNGTNPVTYPLDSAGLSAMNQTSGPAMYGNGAGASGTALGSKATPFFGRYQEHYGQIRSNWQVYTGYTGGYDAAAAKRFPPAAPVKISADYTAGNAYNGDIKVTLYNYAEYSAHAYIRLLAGSTVKYESDYLIVGPMVVSSSKLDPGTGTFSIGLSDDPAVRSITSIKVYWYSQNGDGQTSYVYPVSFSIGGGSESCTCAALSLSNGACICTAKSHAIEVCTCTGNVTKSMIICTCSSDNSKTIICSCTAGNTQTVCSCASGNTQINVTPTV